MNKKKYWFSFVEIIVVVSILWIITISWWYYFHDFVKDKQASIYTQNLQNYIKQLDNDVKSSQIYDYTAIIHNWLLAVSKNISWVEKYLSYSINNNTIEIILEWWTSSDFMSYTLTKNGKKLAQETISWDKNFSIDNQNNYTITATVNNNSINTLDFYRYDANENIEIYDIVDKNNNQVNSFKIENYWWNKLYKNTANENIIDTPIDIQFDIHGYEKTLTLE